MDQIHKQIMQVQYRCNDWIDDHNAPISRSLKNEVQRLEDEAQVNKNPKSVESRVKSVIQILEEAGNSGAMSSNHADELIDQFDHIVQQLRKL
jgi:hypothetical protein